MGSVAGNFQAARLGTRTFRQTAEKTFRLNAMYRGTVYRRIPDTVNVGSSPTAWHPFYARVGRTGGIYSAAVGEDDNREAMRVRVAPRATDQRNTEMAKRKLKFLIALHWKSLAVLGVLLALAIIGQFVPETPCSECLKLPF